MNAIDEITPGWWLIGATINGLRYHARVGFCTRAEALEYYKRKYPTAKNVRATWSAIQRQY